ncbi:T9SS type A sorting domain-containing protein [Fibrella forsythiae]|uniref:T9SS type A sorting domain-containing protein n=1 Tax=Fibrella forsythiae TaxID=2817061 RepID=A0ABS3JT69_9BACT|nr:T9SS type A sorting domain-containing protein [Fibrella forsythiae]MBO0952648.1 T9SS type A sorting domain-containing protein [Fibrella forsythiae]
MLTLISNYIGNGDDGIGTINQAKANGGNAVLVTMLWSTVNNWYKDNPNPWKQYDDQIAAARRNGMKVAIRLWVDNQRFDVPSFPGDDLSDGMNGWDAADRMQGFNQFGQNLRVFQQFDGLYQEKGTFRVLTSYAAPATIDKATSFATRAAERYRYLLDSNELLFITVTTVGAEFAYPMYTTRGLEGDFERLYDYSEPMVRGYRTWLKSKYRGSISRLKAAWRGDGQPSNSFDEIRPKAPSGTWKSAFEGEAGQDWYRYRYSAMKTFLYEASAAIKNVDNRYKVIHEYGSVYDKLTVRRGTFSFKDLGESLDGIKMNDGHFSDYRFSTDMIRSNSPGKLIVNEIEGNIGRRNNPIFKDELLKQFTECFEHGTHIVTVFNFDFTFPADREAFKEAAERYTTNTNPVIRPPKQTATYTTSGILYADGCSTNRDSYANDCQAYKDWRTTFDQSGGQPVNFLQQDDILFPATQEAPRYSRVLVVGNAITEKNPDPSIGWTGGPWGMAATSRANDYVSLLTEKLKEQNADVSVQRLRLDEWEQTYASKTFPYKTAVTDKVAALWAGNKPDLVLISLSENVSQTNFNAATFRDELLKLVVSTGLTTGVVVLRNSFLPGQSKSNAVLRQVADETGWQFVNLACIRGDAALSGAADWPRADSLVKRFPGNAGMKAIADLYCPQIPGLNCNQTGPVPVVSRVRVNFGVDACPTCSDRCRSGLIQGSQDSTTWTTLAILHEPARGWNDFVVNADQPWRYVRYVAARNCFGELTEIEFYMGNRKLKGTPFGSGASTTSNGFMAALDGNLATVWKGATAGPKNTIGFDFGVPSSEPDPIVWCPDTDESKTAALLELAPNPADDYVTYLYQMPTADAVTLEVVDLAGRLIYTQHLAGSEARQQYVMHVGNWRPGMYITKIKAGTAAASKRFLIAR